MDIGKRALTLATALVLGAAIVGLTAEPAAAERKTKDNGVRCSLTGETVDPPTENDYEFYTPGTWESVRHPSGDVKMLECQKDGTWKEVKAIVQPRVPGRVPSHTFEQAP
jgi:hypothetical protein